jgi:hypothetical protein
MSSFSNQMNVVRERQQSKFETKLMTEEDSKSFNLRVWFNEQKLKEEQQKEYEKMQQIQLKIEKRQMDKFIDDYVIKEFNRHKGKMLNLSTLREIALNEYYNRKLIEQQDEEYNLCVQMDLQKLLV